VVITQTTQHVKRPNVKPMNNIASNGALNATRLVDGQKTDVFTAQKILHTE